MKKLQNGLMILLVIILILSGCQTVVEEIYSDVKTEEPVQETEEAEVVLPEEVLKAVPTHWRDDATIYEVNLRQYTEEGTLAAFEEHLPRLQSMGVEILWFMPIHPISELERKGSLGSYYSIADYKGFNSEFGSLDEFKEFVQKSHGMGFKIILDWVPNHTGWDHKWITEHPEWYTQVGDVIIHPAGTDWTDVADLNYDNSDMRAEMISDMAFWVEEVDVDGFRCDVAGSVPTDFWNVASKELNEIKPLFMLAEDGSNFALLEEAFDANYSWNLMNTMNASVSGNQSANSLKSDLVRLIALYPEGTYPMNFVTNHDENSWNGTAFERLGQGKTMMEALVFVAPGMPLIYSGQEASLDKRLLFFEKDEIDWSDLSHQEFLSDLVQLKKDNSALWNGIAGGDLQIIKTTDKHILAFIRTKGNNRVLYVGNLKDEALTFELKAFEGNGSFKHYLSQEVVELSEGTEMTLEGFGFEIYTVD